MDYKKIIEVAIKLEASHNVIIGYYATIGSNSLSDESNGALYSLVHSEERTRDALEKKLKNLVND